MKKNIADRSLFALKRDLRFFHMKDYVLIIDPVNMGYLRVSPSEMVILNLIKRPITFKDLAGRIIWFEPGDIWKRMKFLFDLGFLEINGYKSNRPKYSFFDEFSKDVQKKIKNNSYEKILNERTVPVLCKECVWPVVCRNLYSGKEDRECNLKHNYFMELMLENNNKSAYSF